MEEKLPDWIPEIVTKHHRNEKGTREADESESKEVQNEGNI